MKNLYNSPFEYWEKIGYVGYNNYTDLHLNVKKKLIMDNWSGSNKKNKTNMYKNTLSNLYKKNIHILSFLFYHFFKHIHTQFFILKKMIFFLNSWKKKYIFFLKKNINVRVIKYRMIFFINKLIQLSLISLKKWHKLNLLKKKKKIYNFLSVLYNIPGSKRKIFLFKKILKSILKNYTFSNKHMYFFNAMFSNTRKTNLYRPQYLNNLLSNENNFYEEKGIFKTIPKKSTNVSKIKLIEFICNTFNITVFQIKKILIYKRFRNWEDLFYFLHYQKQNKFFGSLKETSIDMFHFEYLLCIIVLLYIYKNIFYHYIFDIYTVCTHLVE